MKNVSLLSEEVNGRGSFKLIGPDGRRLEGFDAFASSLSERPYNTRRTYCYALASFFDFALEASVHGCDKHVTKQRTLDCLIAYREYLLFGQRSGNDLARRVDSTMPSPMVSPRTCETMHAGLQRFLELSDTARSHAAQLQEHGFLEDSIDPDDLLPSGTHETSHWVRQAMAKNSMLAGVMRGGPKVLRAAKLAVRSGATQRPFKKPFPFQHATAFIESLPTARDRAMYSLIAASGGRISECLQLLWEDVGRSDGSIRLVDFRRRENHSSYLALSAAERDRLAWKGRVTEGTLMLEPFASMFFEALETYVRTEYVAHGRHDFVFQYIDGHRRGQPYFLCASSTRAEAFERTVRRTMSSDEGDGLSVHSMRHMYGTYVLNYLPRIDGTYGLPIGMVKVLMGHASISATEQYARHDLDLIEAELAYGNELALGAAPKSLNEMKLEALQARVARLETDIARDNAVRYAQAGVAAPC
jgi:integrase